MVRPDVCPVCEGTGKANPLPVPRGGPGPCIRCNGTGLRPTIADQQEKAA